MDGRYLEFWYFLFIHKVSIAYENSKAPYPMSGCVAFETDIFQVSYLFLLRTLRIINPTRGSRSTKTDSGIS